LKKIENIKFTQNKLLFNLQTIVVDKEMTAAVCMKGKYKCAAEKCVAVTSVM
jgi:hypothetical protein